MKILRGIAHGVASVGTGLPLPRQSSRGMRTDWTYLLWTRIQTSSTTPTGTDPGNLRLDLRALVDTAPLDLLPSLGQVAESMFSSVVEMLGSGTCHTMVHGQTGPQSVATPPSKLRSKQFRGVRIE